MWMPRLRPLPTLSRAGSHLGRERRSAVLLRVADLIERDLDLFARAESQDNGKPVALAREVDIPRAVANFRFFATAILHWSSEAHLTDDLAINYTERSARRRGRLHQPVEPAAVPLHLEDRARAGRRLHGGGQAVGDHPAHGLHAGRALHRGGSSARRAEHRARTWTRKWARPSPRIRGSRRSPSPAAHAPGRRSRAWPRRCSRS